MRGLKQSRKEEEEQGPWAHLCMHRANGSMQMRMHVENVCMHEAALQSRPRACVYVCVCVCDFVRACVYKHARTPEQQEGEELEGASKHVMVIRACMHFCFFLCAPVEGARQEHE